MHAGRLQWFAALVFVAALPLVASCDAVRGSDSTPAATRTPRPTSTVTPIPTATPIPTPIPTPTPELPPNPDSLQRWSELPVHYCVSDSSEGFVPFDEFALLVKQAFAAWGVASVDDGGCGPPVDDDRVNTIGWDQLQNADAAAPDVYEAGVTQTRYSECTSGCGFGETVELVEADVRIDTEPPRRFRTRACLYSTVLHEVGHFLGLEHLPAPAVMAAETTTCADTLTDIDLAALRLRYGERAQPQL